MNENIGKFGATSRQLTAAVRAEREVRHKMFPRLDNDPETEYPFASRDEMIRSYTFAALDLKVELLNFMSVAATLPKPCGDMFCYVAYCDLHERMKMYQKLARELLKENASAVTPKPTQEVAVLA